jgi:hypothetical protein
VSEKGGKKKLNSVALVGKRTIPIEHHLSAKLVPPFADRGCRVVSATDPHDRFTPGERAPGTHWIEGWVDLRAGLDDLEKRKFLTLPGLELRSLGLPARS